MQKLLNIFPLPNFTNWAVAGGTYNYITDYSSDRPVRQDILRLDYIINDNLAHPLPRHERDGRQQRLQLTRE